MNATIDAKIGESDYFVEIIKPFRRKSNSTRKDKFMARFLGWEPAHDDVEEAMWMSRKTKCIQTIDYSKSTYCSTHFYRENNHFLSHQLQWSKKKKKNRSIWPSNNHSWFTSNFLSKRCRNPFLYFCVLRYYIQNHEGILLKLAIHWSKIITFGQFVEGTHWKFFLNQQLQAVQLWLLIGARCAPIAPPSHLPTRFSDHTLLPYSPALSPAHEVLQHGALPGALPAHHSNLRQVQVAALPDGAEGVL